MPALLLAVAVAAVPISLTVLTAVSSASAEARPGELAARLLGPFDVKVLIPSLDEAARVSSMARNAGLPDSSTARSGLTGLSAAASQLTVRIEQAQLPESALTARAELLHGTWPERDTDLCVSEAAAASSSLQLGDAVNTGGQNTRLTCIYRERSDYAARSAYLRAPASDATAAVVDISDSEIQVYLGGARDQTAMLSFQDQLLGQGLAFTSRSSRQDGLQVADAATVKLLRRLSWIGIPAAAVILFLALLSMSRSVEADLSTLYLLGVLRRERAKVAALLALAASVTATIVGTAIGLALTLGLRPRWEANSAAQWYGVRLDLDFVVLLVGLLVVGTTVASFWHSLRRQECLEEMASASRRGERMNLTAVTRKTAVAACALFAGSLVFVQSWLAILAAVLVAPAVALSLLSGALWLTKRLTPQHITGLLIQRYLTQRPGVLITTSLLAAVLLAVPLSVVFVMQGLVGDDGSGDDVRSTPRPTSAVYVGTATLAKSDLVLLGTDAGAERVTAWNTALVRWNNGEQDLWVPAVPAAARSCFTTRSASSAKLEPSACRSALAGALVASPTEIADLIGRDLTPAEQTFLGTGGALVLDPRLLTNKSSIDMTVVPGLQNVSLPTIPLRALAVPSGPTTTVSDSVPSVLVSSESPVISASQDTGADGQVRPGQPRALFEFTEPVAARNEQALRRGIVARTEVPLNEEFLVSRLSERASGVQTVVSTTAQIIPGLACLATFFVLLALRRDTAQESRVLLDCGLPARSLAVGTAAVVALASLVAVTTAGAAAALAAQTLFTIEMVGSLSQSGTEDLVAAAAAAVATAVASALLVLTIAGRSSAHTSMTKPWA